MTDSVARALHEHLSDAGITTGYVFTGPNGPMTGQAIWKAWKRVAGAELDHFAAHQLRNTFANELARGGTNLNSVRRLMRHASLVTTQRYLDDDEELERDAVRALDGLKPEDRRAVIRDLSRGDYSPPEIAGLDGKTYPERFSPDSTPEPPPSVVSGDLQGLKNRSDLRFIPRGCLGPKERVAQAAPVAVSAPRRRDIDGA
jgi:Phage integrase family